MSASGGGRPVETLTAAEVALRGRRANVHADDGLHRDLGPRDRDRRWRQEDWLQHAEVAFFRDQCAAASVTLRQKV